MSRWKMRRPPVIDEELARWVLVRPPELQALRAAIQKVVTVRATGADDRDDLAERLCLVATELAGNALRHGRPPTVVMLRRSDGKLILDVHDNDATSSPEVGEGRPSGRGGLGLVLARRLAEDVGWYVAGPGKRVWAAFAISASPGRPA